jgi:hypothetical protein
VVLKLEKKEIKEFKHLNACNSTELKIENFVKILNQNQIAKIRIVSDSMYPIIRTGETVDVVPISDKLNRFDIILFDYYGTPYCHFFWGNTSKVETICTKSLKSPQDDDIPMHQSRLIGKIKGKKLTSIQKFTVYLKILWNRRY